MRNKSFWFSAALFAALTAASVVSAKWIRMSAHVCVGNLASNAQNSILGVYNLSTTVNVDLFCPLVESDYFAKNQVTLAEVYGHDGNDAYHVRAAACRMEFGVSTFTCGPQVLTAGRGSYKLTPSTTAWPSNTGAAYLFVSLPPEDPTGEDSGLRAIYLQGI